VPVSRLIRFPVVALLALGACLGQVSTAAAQGLNVRDDAGVLTTAERQTIHDAAVKAPFSVSVWTVKGGFTGNKAGFVSAADAMITGNDMVVVAVDTVDKFSHVAARNSRLSSAATAAAKSSANSYLRSGPVGCGCRCGGEQSDRRRRIERQRRAGPRLQWCCCPRRVPELASMGELDHRVGDYRRHRYGRHGAVAF